MYPPHINIHIHSHIYYYKAFILTIEKMKFNATSVVYSTTTTSSSIINIIIKDVHVYGIYV